MGWVNHIQTLLENNRNRMCKRERIKLTAGNKQNNIPPAREKKSKFVNLNKPNQIKPEIETVRLNQL